MGVENVEGNLVGIGDSRAKRFASNFHVEEVRNRTCSEEGHLRRKRPPEMVPDGLIAVVKSTGLFGCALRTSVGEGKGKLAVPTGQSILVQIVADRHRMNECQSGDIRHHPLHFAIAIAMVSFPYSSSAAAGQCAAWANGLMRIRTDASCLVARVDGRKVLVYIYINWDQPNAHKHHAMGKGKACGWTGARILQGSSPHRVNPRGCKNMQMGFCWALYLVLRFTRPFNSNQWQKGDNRAQDI